jgi:Mn2+/Fe2+ NRAMP family transporter
VGLAHAPLDAKAFYVAIAVATVLGAASNMLSLSPMTALVWVAVINGVLAVPVMILLMMMARNRRIMGKFCISPLLSTIGWIATGAMALAAIAFLLTLTHAV